MPRRLLYLVTEDWYFMSHRLPMARAARDAGFEVHVATQVAEHGAAIAREGFVLHPTRWRRGRTDPASVAQVAGHLRRVLRATRPALVHSVGLQPSVVGSIAGMGLPSIHLNALAGLGYTFTSRTARARAIRAVLTPLMRTLFDRAGASILVQNPDDEAAMVRLGIRPSTIHRIPGSGVDASHLVPLPEPPGAVRCGFVGRLLEDKGLHALLAAHELLAARGTPVPLTIAGVPDAANPASIAPLDLASWRERPRLELLGHVDDIRQVWARCHIAVLPSRREGLPLSLLEAAACGRPLVATDVPGCREIARPENALLVPVDDPVALASAIARLASDATLRSELGKASRRLVESTFSSERIGAAIVRLYEQLLHRPSRRGVA